MCMKNLHCSTSERWSSHRCRDPFQTNLCKTHWAGPFDIFICKAYLVYPSTTGGWFQVSVIADSEDAHWLPVHHSSLSTICGCLATSTPVSTNIRPKQFKYEISCIIPEMIGWKSQSVSNNHQSEWFIDSQWIKISEKSSLLLCMKLEISSSNLHHSGLDQIPTDAISPTSKYQSELLKLRPLVIIWYDIPNRLSATAAIGWARASSCNSLTWGLFNGWTDKLENVEHKGKLWCVSER
jgi:hypothetical protein